MGDTILDNLEWLGHDGYRLVAENQVIYFDPFKLSGEHQPADIILITHEHFDHCSPEDIEKIQKKSTTIITEPNSAKKLSGTVITLKPGESCEVNGVSIEAVPSYNTNKKFHPKAKNWLGFIVTVEGVRIYHAGDTDYIPEMKNFKTDIALLPVSGTYVMTSEEAVQAALDIQPRIAVPMHYNSIVGDVSDAEKFAAALQGKMRVEILKQV
ncbi:MAG: MBL fold metallo-hydrolase [Desulfobulbaceae bacterium]|uniref:MBL fold metallo-hydrolase n=1 Tax=Candidatus Desulfobia pelagia TaxID=2841692 RepID=A0A8J6TDH9_9BACT|nr:MBL fold metallo-hydrolase [Candidatus Desulfobia pelagia]